MKTIVLLILAIFATSAYAQGDFNNMRKYYYYKTRLNNCFTKVGLQRGESMPFNQRGAYSTYFSGGTYTKSLKLGDGTSTLGYYIGVLATEYYLLKSNGQRTDSVRHELFCALNAFNRCDALAEGTNAGNANSFTALNGFFIRDDIKDDFVLINYDHFNYYNQWSGQSYGEGNWDGFNAQPATIATDRGFASLLPWGQQYTESTFQSWEEKLNAPDAGQFVPIQNHVNTVTDRYSTTFESQDQVYNLLLGLALVSKFVNDTARDYDENGNARVFPYEYQGVTSLQQEARNIADRILQHIRNDNEWRIKYPGTNKMLYGGNAGSFAYPLAESGCFISGEGELPANNGINVWDSPKGCGGINSGDSYHTWYSSTQLNFEWWNSLAKTVAPKIDQAVFLGNLSAISNGIYGVSGGQWVSQLTQQWVQSPSHILNVLGFIVQFVWNLVTLVVNIFLDFDFDNSTGTGMTDNAYFWGIDYAPVARAILHPTVGNYVANWDHTMDYLLDVAPCDGTRNFGDPNEGHYEWSSDSRCDHPNRRGTDPRGDVYNSDPNSWPGGEFNGIDYMLYHNLWAIYSVQHNQNYFMQDYSHQYVNRNGGILNINQSTQTFLIEGFETVNIENTIIPDATTGAIRAGKYIHLGAGTHIGATANAHLFVQPYSCATEPTSIQRLNNNITLEQEPKKLHYIEYSSEPIQLKQKPLKEIINSTAINNTAVYEKEPSKAYQDSVMNAAMLAYVGGDAIMVNPVDENKAWKVYFYLHQGEFANIAVMDMKGNVIATENNLTQKDNGYKIDLSDKANGMYILKFIRSTGKEETKKLLRY